jgi:hypothetical protein
MIGGTISSQLFILLTPFRICSPLRFSCFYFCLQKGLPNGKPNPKKPYVGCPFFFFVCPWVLKQKVISKKIILSDLEVLALYNLHSKCKYIQLSAGIYCFIGIPPLEGYVYILFSVAFGLVICGIMWNLYELYNNSQQRPINVDLRCQVQHHLNYEKFPG